MQEPQSRCSRLSYNSDNDEDKKKEDEDKKKKSVAFMASSSSKNKGKSKKQESSDDDEDASDIIDEAMALFVRKFGRFMKKKGYGARKRRDHIKSKEYVRRCYICKSPNHVVADCPTIVIMMRMRRRNKRGRRRRRKRRRRKR